MRSDAVGLVGQWIIRSVSGEAVPSLSALSQLLRADFSSLSCQLSRMFVSPVPQLATEQKSVFAYQVSLLKVVSIVVEGKRYFPSEMDHSESNPLTV